MMPDPAQASLATVPQEVRNEICSWVACFDKHDAQQTLASLRRVNSLFCASATPLLFMSVKSSDLYGLKKLLEHDLGYYVREVEVCPQDVKIHDAMSLLLSPYQPNNVRHYRISLGPTRYPGYTVQVLLFISLLKAATKLQLLDIRCLSNKLLHLDIVEFPNLTQLQSMFIFKLSMGQNTLISLFEHSKFLREVEIRRIELQCGTWERVFAALLCQGTITRLIMRSNGYSSFGTSANLRPNTPSWLPVHSTYEPDLAAYFRLYDMVIRNREGSS